MTEQSSDELHFSPDFATQVLAQAEAVAGRRRKLRNAGITVAATGAAIAVLWSIPSSREVSPRPAAVAQIADADEFAFAGEGGSDPLQWMFPDARPVAQFADQYSTASTGGAEQRQRLLFADEADGTREP
jgi:hypothetical protein